MAEKERDWRIIAFDANEMKEGKPRAIILGERKRYEAAMRAMDLSPRAVVRRIRDNVSRHLGGLNEDEAQLALEEAEDVLGNELMLVRMVLASMEADDDPDDG